MKHFKKFLLILLLFTCYIFVSAVSYSSTISSDLSDSVFRLHIVANSDSDEDQNLKLLVRDNILAYMKEFSDNISSKEDAINVMKEHLDDFEAVATKTILDNRF